MTTSTRATLERELQEMQDDLLRMGGRVDQAIAEAMRSLEQRDYDVARQVVAGDAEINALRFRIEENCLRLIATQQPAAGDLRAVVAGMNIVVDLERMGDHAAGIGRVVLRMGDEPLLKPLIDMPRMAEICRRMLRQALQAYLARDAEGALAIARQDDTVDGLYQQIFRELLTFMIEDPRTTTRALSLLFSAHNLERIGDRVTNIVERIVFMTSGEMREVNPEPGDSAELS